MLGLAIAGIGLSGCSGKRKRMRNCRGVCVKRLFSGFGASHKHRYNRGSIDDRNF